MCEPTTLAAVSIGTTVIGAGMQAYGQYQQGKAANAAASYRASVMQNNQAMAERQAADAIERGKVAEGRYRDDVARLKGRQKVAFAANGVDVNEGSALDLLAQTGEIGEMDALTIRSNAEREAYGYRVQAQNFGSEAALTRASGQGAYGAGLYSGTSSLLTNAGGVADKWYRYKDAGIY